MKEITNRKILRITTVPHSLDLLMKGQLKYISNNGFNVFIASSYGDGVDQVEKREGVKHFDIPMSRSMNPFMDLIALFHTLKLILKLRPQIVHTHSPKAGIVGMLASFICRVPVKIHTVAGLPLLEEKGFKRKLLIYVEKLTYSCANYVLPNSNNLKSIILGEIYKKESKVIVIGDGSSNGIDLDYFASDAVSNSEVGLLRREYNINVDDIIFSFVGRLAYYKGINELVEAFTLLNKKYSNLKLILVGPIEDLNPLKEETLNKIKNNQNIISVGHQEDIRPFLKVSDIFVFPSYREGFPQSLMQAAAMNLACIATDINGCNEILDNNKTGLLIKVKDAKAIVDACEMLINNEDLRHEFANKARQKMEEKFEQKKFWNKMINFYKSCLEEKGLKL